MTNTIPISLAFEDGCAVEFSFQPPPSLALSTAGAPSLALDVGTIIEVETAPYTGAYSATPSASAQTFPTTGLRMTADFTVAPIPSNYGLVTWDGSVITVS